MISASLVKELREKTGAGMLDCKKALEETNGVIDDAIDWLREKGISKAAKKADRIATEGIASILIDNNNAAIIEVNSETDFVAENEEFKSLVNTILNIIIKNDIDTLEELLESTCDEGTINDLITQKIAKIGEKISLRRFAKIIKSDSESFGEYIHMGGKIAVLTLLDNASASIAKEVALHAAAMRPTYVKIENVPKDVLEKEKIIMKEQLINEGKQVDRIESILIGKVKKYYEDVCLENQIFVKSENKETVGQYVANNGGTIVNMIRFEVGEGMEKKTENFAEEVAKQING